MNKGFIAITTVLLICGICTYLMTLDFNRLSALINYQKIMVDQAQAELDAESCSFASLITFYNYNRKNFGNSSFSIDSFSCHIDVFVDYYDTQQIITTATYRGHSRTVELWFDSDLNVISKQVF